MRDKLKKPETPVCLLPKLKVGGSNPLSRSNKIKDLAILVESFFIRVVVGVVINYKSGREKVEWN